MQRRRGVSSVASKRCRFQADIEMPARLTVPVVMSQSLLLMEQ